MMICCSSNPISYIVFVAFIFLIVVVLMNLLNGLAVSDTGLIRYSFFISFLRQYKNCGYFLDIQSLINLFYNWVKIMFSLQCLISGVSSWENFFLFRFYTACNKCLHNTKMSRTICLQGRTWGANRRTPPLWHICAH